MESTVCLRTRALKLLRYQVVNGVYGFFGLLGRLGLQTFEVPSTEWSLQFFWFAGPRLGLQKFEVPSTK